MCSAEKSMIIGIAAATFYCCASSSVSTLARGIRRGWLLWDAQGGSIRYERYWWLWRHGLAARRN
jgi:hypothetical protein